MEGEKSLRGCPKLVTIGYSTHRPESLPFAERLMERHEAIFLEDPETPGFEIMLKDDLSIEEYLMGTDTEYPEFGRRLCRVLRRQYAKGKRILQVEPFIDELLGIHEFFADGGTPGQIAPGTPRFEVYMAEKRATGRLLEFYKASVDGDFEENVRAVMAFASADAARFRLRDKMRAETIARLACGFSSVYVEAGEIHAGLFAQLRTRMSKEARIAPTFLLAPVYRQLSGRRHIFGPGDILTLRYVFHSGADSPELRLLSARSLLYSKLLEKEEILDAAEPHPHTRNEIETIRKVDSLTMEDCETIFPAIRVSSSADARAFVDDFLANKRKKGSKSA